MNSQPLAKQTTQSVRLCEQSDLVPHSGVAVLYKGQQIALFYLPDSDLSGSEQALFAVGNYDPFGAANVISRGIIGDIKGELVVASPLYKQHFSLRTGKCLEDASVAIPVFDVHIEDNWVMITA